MAIHKSLSILACVASLAFPSFAHAAFIDRGGGMIYDDALDITWLQDFNYAMTSGYDADGLMTWDAASAWAASLNVGGYEGWRLPTHAGSENPRPETPTSENEIGSLWYYFSGSEMGYINEDADISPFFGLPALGYGEWWYWSGSVAPDDPSRYWRMDMGCACWGHSPTGEEYYATAVRDGDVAPIPEPSAPLLFGAGTLIVGWALRRRAP